MKIGVLTLPLHTNYGGVIQAFAMQKVLKDMGHEVKHINKPFRRKDVSLYLKGKRLISRSLGRYQGYINYEQKMNKWLPFMMTDINKFLEKHIELAPEIASYTDVNDTDFDAIVVGSDQVWRPKMFQDDISFAFLSFVKSPIVKKIAYAASFGTDSWEYTPEQTYACSSLVKQFDAIAVREKGGVLLCKKNLGIDVEFVCDPTFLLEKEEYIKLIHESGLPVSSGTLFNYLLDDSPAKKELVEYISKDKELKPFQVNTLEGNFKLDLEHRRAQPIEAWLRGFYDSEYIVTDSFHACVFAIIFRKPFAVVPNRSRGLSRFETLLSTLGLTDRIIDTIEDYKNLPIIIDYDTLQPQINKFKASSNKFLLESLRN